MLGSMGQGLCPSHMLFQYWCAQQAGDSQYVLADWMKVPETECSSPPNVYVEILTPKVMVLGGRGLLDGISAFIKEA